MSGSSNTFKNLKEAEKEARKKIIIDAAERVFALKPHDRVSMKEIASEAGIATASIYTYFKDQEDLFIESFIRDTKSLTADLGTLSNKDSKLRFQDLITAFIDFFTHKDYYFRMMANFMLTGKISDNSLERFNSVLEEMIDSFEAAFNSTEKTPETRLYSHILFAFINGLLISFRRYPGRSEEETVDHMKKLGNIFAELIEKAW